MAYEAMIEIFIFCYAVFYSDHFQDRVLILELGLDFLNFVGYLVNVELRAENVSDSDCQIQISGDAFGC